MGHRFSKPVALDDDIDGIYLHEDLYQQRQQHQHQPQPQQAHRESQRIPIPTTSGGNPPSNGSLLATGPPPTFNLHIEESADGAAAAARACPNGGIEAATATTCSGGGAGGSPTQIIIKIQLARMQSNNGNEDQPAEASLRDANANEERPTTSRAAGGSVVCSSSNNNNNNHTTVDDNDQSLDSTGQWAEYSEVLNVEEPPPLEVELRRRTEKETCVRRPRSSLRKALNSILEPSLKSSASKNKDRKDASKHSKSDGGCGSSKNTQRSSMPPPKRIFAQMRNNNIAAASAVARPISLNGGGAAGSSALATPWQVHGNQQQVAPQQATAANVIIPINQSSQLVIQWLPAGDMAMPAAASANGALLDSVPLVPPRSTVMLPSFTTSVVATTAATGPANNTSTAAGGMAQMMGGLIIHSQADFVHFLVPDLEQITNTSYYWGKIDRYEAERLLEGKPEGTFLLRDSAQEEYLFSVTFRKYGRSLHARIEQRGHEFSFDCHDPTVFTSPTVTGLLKRYRDPACVMFFEPLLTIPLHRRTTFSLQQLCRATVASHVTYDGIDHLELPGCLRSYLKEYHYKQKLRVKRVCNVSEQQQQQQLLYAACA